MFRRGIMLGAIGTGLVSSAWGQGPAASRNAPAVAPARPAPAAATAQSRPGQPALSAQHVQAWQRHIRREQQYRLPLPVFAKVVAPNDTRISFFAAGGKSHHFTSSAMVGLRTRHRYAFSLENLPGAQQRRFYGTIEVIRGPRIPEGVKGSDVPVFIQFSESDVDLLVRDRMITKIMVLEDPDKAIAVATNPNEPIRYEANLLDNARDLVRQIGREVMVVRIGGRVPTESELADGTAPGSLLISHRLPVQDAKGGEHKTAEHFVYADTGTTSPFAGGVQSGAFSYPPLALTSAACIKPERPRVKGFGPCSANGVPCVTSCNTGAWPIPEMEDEDDAYLCDGGDHGLKVFANRDGMLFNIDPADTIAEFQDKNGKRRIIESNEVCLFAPRFVEVRLVQNIEGYEIEQAVEHLERDRRHASYVNVQTDDERKRFQAAQAIRMRQRPSGLASEQGVASLTELTVLAGLELRLGWAELIGDIAPLQVINSVQPALAKRITFARTLTLDQYPQMIASAVGTGELETFWYLEQIVVVKEKPTKPRLQLIKTASTSAAKLGDEVSFTIVYQNVGTEPLDNVAVVDSLVSRLEYIPNSAQSNRDAVFSAQENDVGSSILRWEIKGILKPGEKGQVVFKTRIR